MDSSVFTAMSEATTQEELFRAFESQPGNYRLIHHPALRERPVRCLREVGSLKIFNFRNADIGAEYNVMQIFEDLEKSQPFEHNHIK